MKIDQGTDLFNILINAMPKSDTFQISIDLPSCTVIAMLIGFLVTEQKVPDEIIKALDGLLEKDYSRGWGTIISAWQGCNDDVSKTCTKFWER